MNSSGTNYSWKLTFLTFLVAFGLVFGVATAGLAQTGPPGQQETDLVAEVAYTIVDGSFVAKATLYDSSGNKVNGDTIHFESQFDSQSGTDVTGSDGNPDGVATYEFNAPSSGGTYEYKAYHPETTDYFYSEDLADVVVNTPPVVSNVSKSGDEDEDVNFTETDFTDNFTDADGDNLTQIKVTSLPSNGTLKLGTTDVVVGQEIPVGNLGSLIYTPDQNWNGEDSFGWNGYDGSNYADTGASVNITINPVPDPPTVEDDTFSIPEDATDGDTVGTVTASDPEGDITSYDITSGDPDGVFAIDNSGQITVADSSQLDHETTPSYTLTVEATDSEELEGDGSITVNVTDVQRTLTLTFSGDGTGQVTVNEGNSYGPGDAPVERDFDHGTAVNLEASTDQDNGFIEWTLDDGSTESSSTTTVTVDADKTVDARFEPATTNTFGPGDESSWEIISYPLEAVTAEFDEVFDELAEGYTFQADEVVDDYDKVSGSSKVSNKEGYWVTFGSDQEVAVEGTEVTEDVTIDFPDKGWYMISTPYESDWADIEFSGLENDGVGNARLVVWNSDAGDNGRYENVYSDSEFVLDPWEGYWVKAVDENASLTFTQAVDSTNGTASAKAGKLGSYSLPASVDADELDYPPTPPSAQEITDELEIMAAPNPVSTGEEITFRVTSGNSTAVSGMSVNVFTSSGSHVFAGETSGSTLQWDAEGLANGVYLYQVHAEVGGATVSTGAQKLLVVR